MSVTSKWLLNVGEGFTTGLEMGPCTLVVVCATDGCTEAGRGPIPNAKRRVVVIASLIGTKVRGTEIVVAVE